MNASSNTAVAGPNRFERRRERTRQDLLAAATRVLAEKGLHQTKIADIEKEIREGIASGAFVPLPPALVAQAVVGMATQVISWWTEHESVPIETLIETTTTLALRGITPGAAAKGARHG